MNEISKWRCMLGGRVGLLSESVGRAKATDHTSGSNQHLPQAWPYNDLLQRPSTEGTFSQTSQTMWTLQLRDFNMYAKSRWWVRAACEQNILELKPKFRG